MQPIGMRRKRVEKSTSAKEEKKSILKKKNSILLPLNPKHMHTKPYQYQHTDFIARCKTASYISSPPIQFCYFLSLSHLLFFSAFFQMRKIKYSTNTSREKRMTLQMKTFPQRKFHTHAIFVHCFRNGNNTALHYVCELVWFGGAQR